MAKALVLYATKTGNTRSIAESLAEGLRETGVDVTVMNANEAMSESDLAGYDIYLFGSATYHHEMTDVMKKMLVFAERANLQGKVGGVFGAYGWSGEAPKKIHEKMEYQCGMNMIEELLRIKVPVAPEMLRRASMDFGRKIGATIKPQS
ncbi:MAG: FprA family A-type flavoprotein [Acidobacteria bacterium]|nr:FprA family A-type flavoprotein [Acidobacteriota bacterium]